MYIYILVSVYILIYIYIHMYIYILVSFRCEGTARRARESFRQRATAYRARAGLLRGKRRALKRRSEPEDCETMKD
jgi:hypothetical protein